MLDDSCFSCIYTASLSIFVIIVSKQLMLLIQSMKGVKNTENLRQKCDI